jgi:hypothetical protein
MKIYFRLLRAYLVKLGFPIIGSPKAKKLVLWGKSLPFAIRGWSGRFLEAVARLKEEEELAVVRL